ncbi:hypothetical protein PybrP1_005386 [[Pythium] brassicae (nom. inval.)]|nr:hypothetical protein PybrP1_005386 [[Pythium] brassicae (nom. inval.)]
MHHKQQYATGAQRPTATSPKKKTGKHVVTRQIFALPALQQFEPVLASSPRAVNKLVSMLDLVRLGAHKNPERRPVVFVGPFEHHSNLLPWRESGAKMVIIPEGDDGKVCVATLAKELKQHAHRPLRIGAFSAASNLTGVLSDVDALCMIDMNPALPTAGGAGAMLSQYVYRDGIFLSGHKFVGGPGATGLLVAILELEHANLRRAFASLSANENIVLLGRSDVDKLPIFSLLVRFHDRFLHYNFVCALLNDLFGVQNRGGCQCAGPYAARLLGIELDDLGRFTDALSLALSMADAAAPADKREKKRSYTVEEKLAIVQAARSESLRAVARRYNVDRNCIRAWRDKEPQLAELHPSARRLPGAGRRPSAASATSSSPAKRKATPAAPSDANTATVTAIVSESTSAEQATDAPPPLSTEDAAASSALKRSKTAVDEDFLLIGFQGKEGAFSDVAARCAFAELQQSGALSPAEFETVGYAQVGHVMDAIERGEVEFGVLPVENSLSGTFHGHLDRLLASHLKIVGEVACVEELCLCALPAATAEDIRCLLSHPAVLDHCEEFICDMERRVGLVIDRQATWDSAGACQIVKQESARSVAAIASSQAAAAHGLAVLETGVGDELNNETRYMILGRLDARPLPLGLRSAAVVRKKSSVVIAVPNEAQALFKIVAAFALRNLMIIKIESRPAATAGSLFTSETHHWDYIFYVDYISSQDEAVNEHLRGNLEEFALWVKDLGTYSSSAAKANVEPPRWKNICSVISC